MYGLTDTHCHITDERLFSRIDEIMENAKVAGVVRMLVVCVGFEEYERAEQLREKGYSLDIALGFHPCDLYKFNEADYRHLEELAACKKLIAIGEIGLDYHWDDVAVKDQKIGFIRQLKLAEKYHLKVVEDAAQGVEAYYHGKALGTIGDFGCYSFHETKNYTMGEGGALVFQKNEYQEKAEILREKGTDRSKFFRGQVDKYRWIDYGSSYLPSEMNAAYLYAQLEEAEKIDRKRHQIYDYYHEGLKSLEDQEKIRRPFVPEGCKHNAHMYYIKVKDLETRSRLITYLKENGICTAFHYVPLHSSPAGRKFGRFSGEDVYTTRESERLLRLPMFYNLEMPDVEYITEKILSFEF